MTLDRQDARRRDEQDPLAVYRERFVGSDDLIYLDGNSLGRLSHASRRRLHHAIDHEWGERLIRSWNEGWFTLANRVGDKLGQLLGARAGEVVVADSTSVNLFKLVTAALRHQQNAAPHKTRIVTDSQNFPSDLYILQGVIDLLGGSFELVVVDVDETMTHTDPADQIEAALDEHAALLTLSHTAFKSGYVYDSARLTAAAHGAGALVLWDVSHSVGALPLQFEADGVDLAVGCTYKYVNGGPGAPAFLYVREKWHDALRNPIAGWFGQKDLFALAPDYTPAAGLQSFLTGTPPVLSLTAIEPGVDLLLDAGMDALRAKSIALTEYFVAHWAETLRPLGFTLNSPRAAERRGSHISLGHPEALGIDLALIEEMGVLPDFRAPDNLRLGFAPIYTSFTDIFDAVERLARVVREERYTAYARHGVTVT